MKKSKHFGWRTVAACAALALVVTGCATFGAGLETPSINLAGIRLLEVKGFESVFEVDLRVINPNETALAIRGVECDLTLEGSAIAKGVANPEKDIAAYSSDIVTVTVYASMLNMVGIAHRLVRGFQKGDAPPEKWAYAVKGHLRMGDTGWLGKLPFDTKGEIDLRELTGSPRGR